MSSIVTDGSARMGESTAPTTPVDLEREELAPVDEMRQAISDISLSWADLADGFAALQEYTEQFMALPLQYRTTPEEIQALRDGIEAHDQDMEEEYASIKSTLEIDVKEEIAETIKVNSNNWAALIREEAKRQVREQVDIQITEHLPESLQDQVDESKRQLEGIKISLQNSQARMQNSFIGSTNIEDNLSPILTSGGMKSPYYPPNARCLFGYDLDSAKALSRDYELTESDDLHVNFQQFLRHIGTGVEVAVSPR